MQKQGQAALQKVKDYAAKQPKSAPIQEFLGVLLMANGNRKGGPGRFSRPRKQRILHLSKPTFSLVQSDIIEGRLDEAQHRLETVISSDPGNTTAKLWRGNLEFSRGDQKAALSDFRQVVETAPENAQALNNLCIPAGGIQQTARRCFEIRTESSGAFPFRPNVCGHSGMDSLP